MWFVITALILAGLALLVIEVVFIPGTTVVGLIGLLFVAVGITISYSTYGSTIGTYVLTGTAVGTALSLYLSFRKGAWKKFALNTSIDSQVNKGMYAELNVGDEGVAVSTLRPIGKGEFQNKTIEVKTLGNYIDAGTRIKIVQVFSNQAIVEPLTQN
jgi:membrane-bound ClpP family serine protease